MEMTYEDKNFRRFVSDNLFIGRGAFGDVYGPCHWNGKKCAIKKRWITNDTMEDIEKELFACVKMMSLHHKSLITVYDVSLEPPAIYILMEFASGGSLSEVLSVWESDLPSEILKDWGTQIAEGMSHLHKNNIVHRDLKSPNIVIKEADASSKPYNKTLKITDFDQIREHKSRNAMSIAGTCAWSAPEVLTEGRFSKASDVWSYGVVLWEILTRNIPYKGVPDQLIIAEAQKGEMKLEIPDTCPGIIKSFLKKCLSNDKDKRPSFDEILFKLQGYLGQEPETSELQQKDKKSSESLGQRIKKRLAFLKNDSLPPNKKIASSDAIRTIKDQTRQYRYFLEERMDPDSGLLDKIRTNEIISWRDMDDVTSQSSSCKRNSKLLDYILANDQCDGLIVALRYADQTHIANYLTANGDYSDEFGEDWPLTTKEISILDANQGSLVDLLELTDLLGLLHSSKVINRRQKDSISSKPTQHEKNDALLKMLRRRSLRDYRQTISCLHQSHQSHIAEILECGEVVLRVHANLNGDEENAMEIEDNIVEKMTNILTDKSVDEAVRLLGIVQSKVIAAKTGQSIVLYIKCKTIKELEELHQSLTSGRLKDSVEECFNRLIRPQKIALASLTSSTEEFQKMRTYFKEEEISRRGLKRKHSSDTELTENLQKEQRMESTTETDYQPSTTTLNEVPLQLLDVVLEKSFLHWILNPSSNQSDEEVIRALASVDFCWFQRITRPRFKERIWERLKDMPSEDHAEKTTMREVIASQATSETEEEEISRRGQKRKHSTDTEVTENLQQQPMASTTEKIKLHAIDDFDPDQMNKRERMELQNMFDRGRVTRQNDPYAVAYTFKRGDKLEIVCSTNISDTDGWWMVRHFDSGKIGYIPRNRVVMETDHQPSKTTLYDLPLEMLDIILQKSYLHWILNSSTNQRDEEVIRSLISVDVCFYQRITRQRFKKAIWRYFKDFFGKTRKRSAIIRNNRNYLLENIQPNEELIASLLSLNCITEEQSHFIQRQSSNCNDNKIKEQSQFIQRQRLNRDKNAELLHLIRSFDETKFSNFIKCLRQTNQKTVAKIMDNGGVVMKAEVQYRSAKSTEAQLLFHKNIEDLRSRTKPRSPQTDKLMSQLREEGIEILDSQLHRQTVTVVVWIWCHSQAALKHTRKLYESNQLTDVLFGLANIPETDQSKVINIDSNQFKKAVVMRSISITFTQAIEVGEYDAVFGVTKLRGEIYVLCHQSSSSTGTNVICVFEDRNPFNLQKKIEIKQIKNSVGIESSEKENCLYICVTREYCVWKMTRETDDEHKIIKWLITDYKPSKLSVSSAGQLLVVSWSSSILMIYGSDAKLIRSIQLPGDISYLYHAVETSIGNFIICYEEKLEEEEEEEEEVEEEEDEEDEVEVEEDEVQEEVEEEVEVEKVTEEDEEWGKEKVGERGSRGRNSEEEAAEVEEGEEEEKEEETKDEECEDEKERESGSNGRNMIKVEKEEEEREKKEGGKRDRVEEKERKSGSSGRKKTNFVVSEVTRDGQIRRFIPSNETQKLNTPAYLSLDSDDRVFVADSVNDRVILLDSDLKWNRILCPTKEEEETKIRIPNKLCYDEEKKQLIVGGRGVNVYTLSRK